MAIRWSALCLVLLVWMEILSAGEKSASDKSNPFGLPDKAMQQNGALVIAGGGILNEEVYEEFIRLAGGEEARLLLIPSAFEYRDDDHLQRVFRGWKEYDVASFEFFHTDDRAEADTAKFCATLEKATGVWIAGGGQGRLVNRYGGTRVEKLLKRLVERGGVVGGTSAGASVQSECMIRYGSATEAVVDTGLGLTKKLVIDQHFTERGRFPRLLGVLETRPGLIGLGLDEHTAVIVQRDRLRVIGDGKATICLGPHEPKDGIVVHRLSHHDEAEFSLENGSKYRLELVDAAHK